MSPVGPSPEPDTPPVEIRRREIYRCAHHRVEWDERRLVASVVAEDGAPWFSLRVLHAVDPVGAVDETLGATVTVTRLGDSVTVRVDAASPCWDERWSELRCDADGVVLTGGVRGHGDLWQVHAFAGRRPPSGFLPSGSALRSAMSPNPDHPRRIIRDAVEAATISVTGSGAEPGVGRWLFTPAPWCLAVSTGERRGDQTAPEGPWAWIGVLAPIAEQTFNAWHYLPVPEGFSLRLDYEGHTRVDGAFRLPRMAIRFGYRDPYQAIAGYAAATRADGGASVAAHRPIGSAAVTSPSWWRRPMFCGWGAQRAIAEHAADGNRHAPDRCTQRNYDEFLAALTAAGVVPGTIVVDDKWAARYAMADPDTERWPDLRGWIAARHAAGQRVLLWWKAWDPEGAPPEACIRMPDGTPVAIDPDSSAGADLVTSAVTRILAPDGLDADGLKVDFTAATPSGLALAGAGPNWGAALLHRLLRLAYDAAKRADPQALVITHAASPYFADVTDMIRLNDVMMLDSPDPTVDVPSHMAYRAAVVRAALPGMPIDTDGWCLPDRDAWSRYLQLQPTLGVPALYYATRFDRTDERLTPADYERLRSVWEGYARALHVTGPAAG